MRRVVWFVGGVAAGAAGAGYAKRKVAATARKLAPANVARGAVGSVERVGRRVADAVREGRAAAQVRERELRAERDGRLVRLGDHLAPRRRGARRRRAGRVRPGHPDAPARARRVKLPPRHAGRRRATSPLVAELRARSVADRVRDGATELSLYRHDASQHGGRGRRRLLPDVDRTRSRRACAVAVATACRSSPAGRAPGSPVAPCRRTAPS